jgi:hypothetical protein
MQHTTCMVCTMRMIPRLERGARSELFAYDLVESLHKDPASAGATAVCLLFIR